MKLIREHIILEKFEEEGDPISDLGIGLISQLKPGLLLLCIKPLTVKVKTTNKEYSVIDMSIIKGWYSIIKDIRLLNIAGEKELHLELATYETFPKYFRRGDLKFIGGEFLTISLEKFLEHFKIVKNLLSEAFTENSDPIDDLNIGMKSYWKKESQRIGLYDGERFDREYVFLNDYKKQRIGNVVYNTLRKAGEGLNPQTAFEDVCKQEEYVDFIDKLKYRKKAAEILRTIFNMRVDWDFVKESLNEKFTEDSDPIHDMNIGIGRYFYIKFNEIRNSYSFVEKGPEYVYRDAPTTYTYVVNSGNIYRKHLDLWIPQELRSRSAAFLKRNPTKTSVPNNLDAAKEIILANYLKWRKRAGLSESLNEKDQRKESEKKTTYLTDNKRLGLHKKIINILTDAKGQRVKVCLVNGSYVKSTNPGLGFKEFVEGGHHYVDSYPGYKKFIPDDEIWVDDAFKSKIDDLKGIIQHEFIERNLMKYKKWSYEKAHEYSNKKESEVRGK